MQDKKRVGGKNKTKQKKVWGIKKHGRKNNNKINTQDKNPVCFTFYKVYEH